MIPIICRAPVTYKVCVQLKSLRSQILITPLPSHETPLKVPCGQQRLTIDDSWPINFSIGLDLDKFHTKISNSYPALKSDLNFSE